jgi:hypothetical protein
MTLIALRSPRSAALGQRQKMKWPQRYPTRANVMGVLFVVVLVRLFAFAVIHFPAPTAAG